MWKEPITGILILLTFSFACSPEKNEDPARAQDAGQENRGDIRFEKFTHDMGTILEGETVGYNFVFTNVGEGPLIINDASASCGCTVPRFSTRPVQPGEKGSVEVMFDSTGRIGQQNKTITVHTNGKVRTVQLTITANIIQSES
jgi:hypothetical protein